MVTDDVRALVARMRSEDLLRAAALLVPPVLRLSGEQRAVIVERACQYREIAEALERGEGVDRDSRLYLAMEHEAEEEAKRHAEADEFYKEVAPW